MNNLRRTNASINQSEDIISRRNQLRQHSKQNSKMTSVEELSFFQCHLQLKNSAPETLDTDLEGDLAGRALLPFSMSFAPKIPARRAIPARRVSSQDMSIAMSIHGSTTKQTGNTTTEALMFSVTAGEHFISAPPISKIVRIYICRFKKKEGRYHELVYPMIRNKHRSNSRGEQEGTYLTI